MYLWIILALGKRIMCFETMKSRRFKDKHVQNLFKKMLFLKFCMVKVFNLSGFVFPRIIWMDFFHFS